MSFFLRCMNLKLDKKKPCFFKIFQTEIREEIFFMFVLHVCVRVNAYLCCLLVNSDAMDVLVSSCSM